MAQPPAQEAPSPPPVNQSEDPILKNFKWRSIGPANMGGRIDDIEAVESNPYIIYVGFATGGLWKTVNNGTTWEPLFDTYSTSSIGDIAIFQSNPDIVWVGTGEPNNRQSSSFGDGIYKSTDGGKTFTHMGLRETQTIARIVLDRTDPDVAYVAALGHLFGPNRERGIFKTTDGGRSWDNIKFIDEHSGFTDLVIDPSDNKTLYAASYQRRRTPWGFNGGGPGSGIWKTTDAGETWTKLSGGGLPTKDVLGRIGLDVSRSNPNVVYAQIEQALPRRRMPGGGGGRGQAAESEGPNPEGNGVWRSEDKGKTWTLMSNNNNRPMYYTQIRIDPNNDQIVYTCGAPFHKSIDGGKTFVQVQGIAHVDHHALWINPHNSNQLVLGNDGGLDISYDQGATWEFVDNIAVGQFYAVGVDMRKPYYVYGGLQDNGSWGAPNMTRNAAGMLNTDWFRIGGGDGFYVQVDPTDHNIIYSESQGGNIRRLDMSTGQTVNIRPRARRPQRQDQGGQQAAMARMFGRGGPATSNIVPEPPEGERYRFNWNMPIQISPHNPRTIHVGGNKFFKSVNRGGTWVASPDLTKQVDRNELEIMSVAGDQPMMSKNDGTSTYGSITTLAESPVLPGVIWVGTDDGNVQITRDGGATWTNVADNVKGVPHNHQISRVEPSHFEAGTCYLSIDGHRGDDHKPYVFVTRDFGETWTSLAKNLPEGNVNVIREDLRNKNLLFLGTEYALYISLNGGREWKRFMTGLPTVRVDDILIHPRENDLIVGTHGRSIFIIDDISSLQVLTEEVLSSDSHLFDVRAGTQWYQDVTQARTVGGAKNFVGQNPERGTAVSYYLKSPASEEVKITITDIEGEVVRELTGSKEAGLQRVQWDLRGKAPEMSEEMRQRMGARASRFRRQGPAVAPGTYWATLSVGGKEHRTKITVLKDVIER